MENLKTPGKPGELAGMYLLSSLRCTLLHLYVLSPRTVYILRYQFFLSLHLKMMRLSHRNAV